jgi:hypothetical protein
VGCAGQDLRQSAFDRSIYRACEPNSRDQRAPDEQKREQCMKKKNKPVPKFRNEQDERKFWHTHDDTMDYFDFSKSSRVEIEFDRGIEAPVKSISLRLRNANLFLPLSARSVPG